MDKRTLVNMKMVEEIRLKKEVYGGYCIEIHMMSGGIIPIHQSEIEPLQIVYNQLKEHLELGSIVELVDGTMGYGD